MTNTRKYVVWFAQCREVAAGWRNICRQYHRKSFHRVQYYELVWQVPGDKKHSWLAVKVDTQGHLWIPLLFSWRPTNGPPKPALEHLTDVHSDFHRYTRTSTLRQVVRTSRFQEPVKPNSKYWLWKEESQCPGSGHSVEQVSPMQILQTRHHTGFLLFSHHFHKNFSLQELVVLIKPYKSEKKKKC